METFPLNVRRESQGKILFLASDMVLVVELYDGLVLCASADSWAYCLVAYDASSH